MIGEPWSPLILRDVNVGLTRFGRMQADLGISRKVLTERDRPCGSPGTQSAEPRMTLVAYSPLLNGA